MTLGWETYGNNRNVFFLAVSRTHCLTDGAMIFTLKGAGTACTAQLSAMSSSLAASVAIMPVQKFPALARGANLRKEYQRGARLRGYGSPLRGADIAEGERSSRPQVRTLCMSTGKSPHQCRLSM
jgi:hypothetical protein